MKKLLLSSAVLMFLSTAAQTQKKSEITICKHIENAFTLAELEKCNMIIPINGNVKVKSFVISLKGKGRNEDVFKSIPVEGNNFSKEALEIIKSYKDQISKILIEKVIVWTPEKWQRIVQGLEFYLK
ncbi:MAG: hypothetical protein K0S44_2040 [Bacteroidetes bacterium]|jgi:hypothetical protein|nr:hypothetical protein [Bacteroidota bacterium]